MKESSADMTVHQLIPDYKIDKDLTQKEHIIAAFDATN
jgi:hypothetical protein